jgi:hypothetical protein
MKTTTTTKPPMAGQALLGPLPSDKVMVNYKSMMNLRDFHNHYGPAGVILPEAFPKGSSWARLSRAKAALLALLDQLDRLAAKRLASAQAREKSDDAGEIVKLAADERGMTFQMYQLLAQAVDYRLELLPELVALNKIKITEAEKAVEDVRTKTRAAFIKAGAGLKPSMNTNGEAQARELMFRVNRSPAVTEAVKAADQPRFYGNWLTDMFKKSRQHAEILRDTIARTRAELAG